MSFLILATLLAMWMGWFTGQLPTWAESEDRECIEYSRDGSYCFRQTLD